MCAAMLSRNEEALMSIMKVIKNVDRIARNEGFSGEGIEGLYGTIGFNGQMVLTFNLMRHGDLPSNMLRRKPGHGPVVVDFGAGIGRPLLLWTMLNIVERAVGFELDAFKVTGAATYTEWMLHEAVHERGLPVRREAPRVLQRDLLQLSPAEVAAHRPTLGYSFCAGVSPKPKRRIGDIFRAVESMRVLVVVDYGKRNAVRALFGDPEEEQQGEQQGPGERVVLHRTLRGLKPVGNNGTYTAYIFRKEEGEPRR
ncbi:hypothetical protein Agub_g8164 [Astrephomene gubernaculifera]|uniref:DOT1 domain-containing protein n=1 Tax=Astrephomene gubernaculifera TaxID=47775 RepID=A0AAD3DSY5_9CHLO|nr:hypothetical protein Agub_g8164 [Astrephomene gubernaculifera]